MSTVRVMVHEMWDELEFPFDGARRIADLKRDALERARVDDPPSEFVVKYRGATILDESRTLAEAEVAPGASLIALRRRRTAVR